MQLRDRISPSVALLVALLVVLSSGASVTAFAGATNPAASDSPAPATTTVNDDEIDTADEVYVHADGDAVFVYDQTTDDEEADADTSSLTDASGHLGVNVSEGLMHVLVAGDLEESSNVTGDAQVVLTPDSLVGNGSFQTPRPENLEDLDVSVEAERSETDMYGSASFDATYVDDSEYSQTSMLESASTSGEVTTTADAFSTTGSAQVELASDLGFAQHREYTLEEGTDQYRLQASEDYLVSEFYADQWNTQANATETLESQYATIAEALGGSATVTVQSHDWTETESGQYRLDIEYEIVYSNIDDALAQRVSQAITSSEDADVSPETAEALGDAVAELNVDRIHASLDAEGTTAQASWEVSLSSYDALVRAGLDLAEETSEDENLTEQIEQARKNYEAMQASNLEQTFTWDASVSSPSEDSVRVQGEFEYTTTNYEAYVSELEARDVPTQGTMSFSASAQTEGEQVVAELSYSVEQESLVDSTIDSVMNSASQAEPESGTASRVLEAFQRSDFEKAKMNVHVEEDAVRFEAGTSFESMESFQSVMAEEFGGDVTEIYADVADDDENPKAYVRVADAFGENATESEVREHEAVGEDTTIHLPDDWNASETSFPRMDQTAAREYLGLAVPSENDTNGTTTTDGGSGGLPGFGVPAAVAAVAAIGALLAGRRRAREQ